LILRFFEELPNAFSLIDSFWPEKQGKKTLGEDLRAGNFMEATGRPKRTVKGLKMSRGYGVGLGAE